MIKGSYVALVTPFHPDGSVNFDKLKELCNWHVERGTDGIVALGTTGESSTMTHEEDDAVALCVLETIAGRVPVIVGSGSNSTQTAVMKSKCYADMGADGLLVITPYYNKANDEGMIRHFTTIADSVDKPLILYNVPSRTGCNLSYNALKVISKHDNIRGIKEASGNISYVAQIARLLDDKFCMVSGNDDMIIPTMSLGGTGVISVFANLCPDIVHDMVASYLAGDVKKACAMQLEYLDLINAMFVEVNPIPVKEAMNLKGMNVGGYRLPLCEISDGGREVVRKAMAILG